MIYLVNVNGVISMRLNSLHNFRILFYSTLNPILFLIKLTKETISELNHYVRETEKQIGFVVHGWNDRLLIIILGKVIDNVAVIQHRQHLIHSLNILNTRIQFCINKQNSMEHVGMRVNVFCEIICS